MSRRYLYARTAARWLAGAVLVALLCLQGIR